MHIDPLWINLNNIIRAISRKSAKKVYFLWQLGLISVFITSAALCAYFPGGKTSHQRRTLKTIKKNYWGQQNVNSNQTHWCMNLISDLCNLFNYRSTELMSALVDKFWGIFQLRHFVSLRFGIGVFDQERDCSLRCQQYGDTISFWSDLHNMQAPSLCHLSLQWIQD